MSITLRPVLKRLTPAALRWRLAGWVALVTLICTGIAFVAVYRGTGDELHHQIDRELSNDSRELAGSLVLSKAHTGVELAKAASRYMSDQPFAASSTLLFAVIPGVGTSSNRPELFSGSAPDSGETAAQQRDRSDRQRREARHEYCADDPTA